jgi:hypothetical protein
MPMNFCLPKDRVEAFTEGLRSGEINPDKLMKMTSKERSDFLGKYVGEGAAKRVNAEFESKTLLKNQQLGMVNWAKNVSGIKPAVRRDLVKRIKDLDRVLDPAEKDAFLEDLASVRLGADVTQEEAKTIANLSKTVQDTQAKMGKDYTFPTEADRLDYGRAVVRMEDYVSDLKNETKKLRFRDARVDPLGSAGRVVLNTAGLTKSLTASLDNSVIGRQGLKILLTHPTVWARNSRKTFADMVRTWGGKKVMEEVRAEIASRPNALNGTYRREKLALGNAEEDFPTSLPEKIPILGRAFKGSENAFTAFQYRTRADLMDQFVKLAEKTGGDIKGMGLVANSLTGRGYIGKLEPIAPVLNNVFFSPRFMKSNIDALTGQVADRGKMGSLARKEAAKNSVKIISGIAGVLTLANAIAPGSVDLDPRSTDFGKIKVGNTRFDVAGGMAGYATLAARLLTQSTKSGSGVISQLNTGDFGSRTTWDTVLDFFTNKFSPSAQVAKDVLKGEDFEGNKPTVEGEASRLITPIGIQNFQELEADPNSADTLSAVIADALGIGTNTYGAQKESWKNTESKELEEFKTTVGEEQFKEANKQFDNEYNNFVNSLKEKDAFQELSSEDQKSLLSKKRAALQKQVLKDYGFKYKEPKKDKDRFKDLLE